MNDNEWEAFQQAQREAEAEDILAYLIDKYGEEAVDKWLTEKQKAIRSKEPPTND
jgi:uncharacterized protein with ATP-grasp and redox domains